MTRMARRVPDGRASAFRWTLHLRPILFLAAVLTLGSSGATASDLLAELANERVRAERLADAVAAAAKGEGLGDAGAQRLRTHLVALVQRDRAFLQEHWEGRVGYGQWLSRAGRVDEALADLEGELGLELPAGRGFEDALADYAEARTRALQPGPGGCDFHLWARAEAARAGDPARVVVGNRPPGCRKLAPSIAIRSVRWRGGAEDSHAWHGPLPGLSVRLEDGSIEWTAAAAIAHTLDRVPETDLDFERGLLRAGDSMRLILPPPPPGEEPPVLEVEITIVRAVELRGPVLFPQRTGEFVAVYRTGDRAPAPDLAGLAFVPWKEGAKPEADRVLRPIRLPVSDPE